MQDRRVQRVLVGAVAYRWALKVDQPALAQRGKWIIGELGVVEQSDAGAHVIDAYQIEVLVPLDLGQSLGFRYTRCPFGIQEGQRIDMKVSSVANDLAWN